MDLIERDRRHDAIDGHLHELALLASVIGFRAHPLGPDGLLGPKHEHRLGLLEPFLDYFGIRSMRRKLDVVPGRVSQRVQGLGNTARVNGGRTRIRDEDIRRGRPLLARGRCQLMPGISGKRGSLAYVCAPMTRGSTSKFAGRWSAPICRWAASRPTSRSRAATSGRSMAQKVFSSRSLMFIASSRS